MDFKIIRSTETKTSRWSGGTTTELYIYPETSSFQKRDFLFRISRATVEIQESDFTPLPGVDRTLMVLEGRLKLIHENQHESFLEAYEQDSFKGNWVTKSIGMVTDFNLMLREGTKGKVKHLNLNKKEMPLELLSDLNLFYVARGSLNFEAHTLFKGDVLIVKTKGELKLTDANSDLVYVDIQIQGQ